MKIVHAENHKFHNPEYEFFLGRMQKYFEVPDRATLLLDALRKHKIGTLLPAEKFSKEAITAVHEEKYVDFLKVAHRDWIAQGLQGDAVCSAFNVQHPGSSIPKHINGRLGYYTADGGVPITATSWEAIESSAFVALTAQKLVSSGGGHSAFALCRPPGHHASRACAAGYCFLNNAAIAAEGFLREGAKRVVIFDIDYHHGNGTQDIFYDRDDVLCISIHAEPSLAYPYFMGYAEEKGRGKGEGFNANYPLALGTQFDVWGEVLNNALKNIASYGPDALIISLGVDTYEKDPISKFKLKSADFPTIGSRIASVKIPTLFVLEGGYALQDLSINVMNVLTGFENG